MDAMCSKAGIYVAAAAGNGVRRPRATAAGDPSVSASWPQNLPWGFTFPCSLRSFWPVYKNRNENAVAVDDAVVADEKLESRQNEDETRNRSWIGRTLHGKSSIRIDEGKNGELEEEMRVKFEEEADENGVEEKESDVCAINDDDDEKIEFNRESFSELLQKVPLAEARLYVQMSYLARWAYYIPQIKPGNLLRDHGLRFVTSSLEKKVQALRFGKKEASVKCQQQINGTEWAKKVKAKPKGSHIAASAGCQTAASYLNSALSSPCEWFICDDDQSTTRFFVIQGSESLASWQANLLFEPIQFEGLDVLVHRGIYEAAKGIYDQMLPEIRAHLKSHGGGAKFSFTGHSLGGSLAVLVNLMLLIRGEVPRTCLLPVITFGAPSIVCGGDHLLHNLGLPRNHVKSITMHRDIVPRLFSWTYPNQVAEFLKVINGNFRNHPCLNKQKLLYAPVGDTIILQPDNKFSPNHELLPSGSGLYLLTSSTSDAAEAEKQIRAAQAAFLNSPHPLEILSSCSSIWRDHEVDSYLKSLRNVILHELRRMRKARRERHLRRKVLWLLLGKPFMACNMTEGGQFRLSGIMQAGGRTLKRLINFR